MRLWYLGSDATDIATTTNALDPIKAFLQHPGEQADTVTPAAGFPFEYPDDGIAELWFRIREYTVGCSIRLQGSDGGDVWDYRLDFAGTIFNGSGVPLGNEREVIATFNNGAQGGFSPVGEQFMATRKIIINGVTIVDDLTPFGFRMRHGSPVDQTNNPVTRYVYGTETHTWLPNLYIQIGDVTGAGDITGNCLGIPFSDTGFHVITTAATFRGADLTYFLNVFDFLSITTFDLTIEATRWWEYRKADNTHPIWDELSGNRLETPFTQVF